MRPFYRISLLALLAAAACTQQPADVEMKGQATYGRDSSSYESTGNSGRANTSALTVNTAPVQAVPAGAIGVSDIAPPTGAHMAAPSAGIQPQTSASIAVSPNNSPFAKAVPPDKVEVAAASDQPRVAEAAPVNAWNNKPRFSDSAQPAKETMQADVPDDKAAKTSNASYIWPVDSKKLISGFGPKGGGKSNDGINIAAAEGEPVWAAAGGEVVYAGGGLAGYGNMVLIKHAAGFTTAYAHLNRIAVDKYSRVKQGDIIGYVGSTGNVKEPQLHFAMRNGKKEPLDPQKYLGK